MPPDFHIMHEYVSHVRWRRMYEEQKGGVYSELMATDERDPKRCKKFQEVDHSTLLLANWSTCVLNNQPVLHTYINAFTHVLHKCLNTGKTQDQSPFQV